MGVDESRVLPLAERQNESSFKAFEELWQPLLVRLKHIFQNSLYFVCFRAKGMSQQCLIRGVSISMDSGFNGEQFVHLDLGNESEARGRQRVRRKRMKAFFIDSGGKF